jgi:hypothetical protein
VISTTTYLSTILTTLTLTNVVSVVQTIPGPTQTIEKTLPGATTTLERTATATLERTIPGPTLERTATLELTRTVSGPEIDRTIELTRTLDRTLTKDITQTLERTRTIATTKILTYNQTVTQTSVSVSTQLTTITLPVRNEFPPTLRLIKSYPNTLCGLSMVLRDKQFAALLHLTRISWFSLGHANVP